MYRGIQFNYIIFLHFRHEIIPVKNRIKREKGQKEVSSYCITKKTVYFQEKQ